jgi:hypothetical protein
MKKYIFPVCLLTMALMSCGNGKNSDKKDSAKDSAAAVVDPAKPHEVKKGDGGNYAFKPDTAINSIILGNPDCFKPFNRENGSNLVSLGGKRNAAVYYNSAVEHTQAMELRMTKNSKGEDVVYAIIVQQNGVEHAPELSGRPIPSSEFNFISGHGIYIGMTEDYVMSVYSNQAFMEWEQGDTVYLEYKPQPKDGNYFKRYKPTVYSATYKFKNGTLRRMEYSVDPAEFEKQ